LSPGINDIIEETSLPGETTSITVSPLDATPIDEPAAENALLQPEIDFYANLADHMTDEDLNKVSSDLLEKINEAKSSRDDWEKAYSEGLDLLGYKAEDRSTPWPNACGVTHPILSEAATRFVSQAIMEICPAKGPVGTRIYGDITDDKQKTAHRVKEHLNWLLTEVMKEYRQETEQLLFFLSLAGSAFRKVYFDQTNNRPYACFVPAEDLIVHYDTTDIETSPLVCHVMSKHTNEVRKMQMSGFYRDIDLPEPTGVGGSGISGNEIKEKFDNILGLKSSNNRLSRTLLECHVEYDLPGFEDSAPNLETAELESTGIALPYIITLDLESSTVLSIRRNYKEDDPNRDKIQYFVHYKFQPGLGFYGIGFIHQIGGIAKSSTSILRQMVDAGTLANLPSGFKTRGLRIKQDDSPIEPGEFRDVDVIGATLKESILPLPYKEPSTVLYQLMTTMIDEGRRFASINDMELPTSSSEAPVGTTLAIIERSMKVMSAIHARLHNAQKREFDLIVDLINEYMANVPYEYQTVGNKAQDFQQRVDVVPVSDPNATTFAQRIAAQQTAFQIAQAQPNLYNMRELHKQFMYSIGMDAVDTLLPDPANIPPQDPVSENANVLMGQSVKAFAWQNHDAHLTAHQAFLTDPRVQNNPMGQQMSAAMMAHINEHLAYDYKIRATQMTGIPLDNQNPIPPEQEMQIAPTLAKAAQIITGQEQQKMAMEKAMADMQDPVLQAQLLDSRTKAAEVERKANADSMKQQTEIYKTNVDATLEREKIAVQRAKIVSDQAVKVASEKNRAKESNANKGTPGGFGKS
jgi:hypothetical protein